MAHDPHPIARAMAPALARAVLGTYTEGEQRWFAAIEKVRAAMVEEAGAAGARLRSAAVVGSKKPSWARLLHIIVAAARPARALEFGTLFGISGAYQASALAPRGKLITLDIDEPFARRAEAAFAALGLAKKTQVVVGDFAATLDSVAKKHGPFGYVFKDGAHSEEETLSYFERLRPHLSADAVVVFDDITWSAGMARAWRCLRAAPGVAFSVDLFNMGLIGLGDGPPRHYQVAVPLTKGHLALR
jgi:predicted O-methyltransferase YrrM